MDDTLLSRAFEVKKLSEAFDPLVPPTNGHEYLQHVMYEASKCPQVVVADIDRTKIKNHVIAIESPSSLRASDLVPPVEWQQEQIKIFSDVRRKIEILKNSHKFLPISLPNLSEEEKWFDICFGKESQEPSLTLMLSMSEMLMKRVLEYQMQWLEDGLKPNQGKWIYALLACLSLPLTADVCSIVRDLARQCAKLKLSKSSFSDIEFNTLNVIICLVSKYFGQLDLED